MQTESQNSEILFFEASRVPSILIIEDLNSLVVHNWPDRALNLLRDLNRLCERPHN